MNRNGQKKAAVSAGNAFGGKTTTRQSISESGGDVKPDSWREAELQKEHEENARMYGALKKVLLGGLPAIHRGITYRRVSAIIYRKGRKGGYLLQVELEDRSGGSVTIASPRQVEVIGAGQEPEAESPGDGEFRELSAVLKKALLGGIPVICEGIEYLRVAAILYRRGESGGYRIQAELEDRGGVIMTVTDLRSAQVQDPGSCDEKCWINEETDGTVAEPST